jgi:hypothetical protein
VLVLPQQSFATQIRVITRGHTLAFVKVPNTETSCRQQLSVATGVSKVHEEPHSTVRFVGQKVNTGGVVSITVIVWLQVFVFPQQSRASQVRVMNCGHWPLVTVPRTATPWRQQLSIAEGVPNSQAIPHSTVRLVGQNVNTGGVVSTTVMV